MTQQEGETLEEILDGEKTIALLEFPDGVPTMIDELPTVHTWGESGEAVALCSRETLQAIERRRNARLNQQTYPTVRKRAMPC